MARLNQLTIPVFQVNLNNSQYSIIISHNTIGLFISYFNPEHFLGKRVYYARLRRAIAKIPNGENFFLLFCIILNKIKQQIKKNYYSGKKCPGW